MLKACSNSARKLGPYFPDKGAPLNVKVIEDRLLFLSETGEKAMLNRALPDNVKNHSNLRSDSPMSCAGRANKPKREVWRFSPAALWPLKCEKKRGIS